MSANTVWLAVINTKDHLWLALVSVEHPIWLAVGFLGQGLFSARFLVQWLTSERMRKSVIPVAFWYFSLAGGATLLSYAIWREDPVFIAGQAGGLVIYARNLYFIWRERRDNGAAA